MKVIDTLSRKATRQAIVAIGAIAALICASPAFACSTQEEVAAADSIVSDTYAALLDYDQFSKLQAAVDAYDSRLNYCMPPYVSADYVRTCQNDAEDEYFAAVDTINGEYADLYLAWWNADTYAVALRNNICPV